MVKILNRLVMAEKRLRATYNVAPDTPENRRKAAIYMLWFDHELLQEGEAYSNKTGTLFAQSDSRLPDNYISLQSNSQWSQNQYKFQKVR